jgi:D-aminopeptidase
MKVLISVDMEGISGVASRRETVTGWPAGAGKGNDYEPASEARFNALVAGQFGVPVALVTGDDVICEETRRWLPHVETAVVKYAIDRYTARCLPQAAALESNVAENEPLATVRLTRSRR